MLMETNPRTWVHNQSRFHVELLPVTHWRIDSLKIYSKGYSLPHIKSTRKSKHCQGSANLQYLFGEARDLRVLDDTSIELVVMS